MAFAPNSNKDCVLAWEAMPDALQDGLTPRQSDWLDAHLASCDACRAQFAQQQRLQRALSLPPVVPTDVEGGLQRLLARIDAPDIAPARDPMRPGGWTGRALVAAVLVQAIGLGAMGVKLWSAEPQPAPAYRTLSQEAAPPAAASIRLVPDPAMTVADLDALLRANGLRVVGGPNAVGAYTLALSSGGAGRDAVLQRLRATHGIRMAEPVAGTP
jgi:hypothetical protein